MPVLPESAHVTTASFAACGSPLSPPAGKTAVGLPLALPRRRVLVLDDEPALRLLAGRVLERLGQDCTLVGTTAEASCLLSDRAFDLFLCDYHLSGETAALFIEAIVNSGRGPRGRILLCTGAPSDDGVARLVRITGIGVLPKPYGIAELRAVLEGPAVPAGGNWVGDAAVSAMH